MAAIILSTLEKIAESAARNQAYQINEYIKLVIKPKPRFMPEGVWKYLLSKLIYIEKLKA